MPLNLHKLQFNHFTSTTNVMTSIVFIFTALLKIRTRKNCVTLRHDGEAAENYVLECDALWSGIEILPVCRKKKKNPLSPASVKIKWWFPFT
jgi:hypothetical protein